MDLFRALLLPLAAFCVGRGVVLGGRAGHILAIAGTVLAGFAVLLVLTEA